MQPFDAFSFWSHFKSVVLDVVAIAICVLIVFAKASD